MLCFVETEPSVEYAAYVHDEEITRVRVDIATNKEGKVNITTDSVCEALLTVLDASNYPLYIHCNQGRHRTGCVIACMRKVQGWPIAAIISEYETYASPKMRPGDVDFITNVFQPEAFLAYAKAHGTFEHRPALANLLRNNAIDIQNLLQLLATEDELASSSTSLLSIESKADSGIDLLTAHMDPAMLAAKPQMTLSTVGTALDTAPEVSVTECDPMSPPIESANSQPFFGSLN
jgi:tyrosine-protein phosphatase SIW14